MSLGTSSFASVIEEHLELKRRNQTLDADLPLDEFVGDDPFQDLFYAAHVRFPALAVTLDAGPGTSISSLMVTLI